MTVDLDFASFSPTRGRSGTSISANLLRSDIPYNPVEAVPMGAIFTPQGEGHPFTAENVIIQDNVPSGFTRYSISVPDGAFIGEYSFELMVRFVPADKTRAQFLAKIHSKGNFSIVQEEGARLISLIPASISAAKFEEKTYNVRGINLDQIDETRIAYLNNPATGRMRIKPQTDRALQLIPAKTGRPLEPNRYRVLAYLKNSGVCNSTAYLTIEED